MLIAKLIKHLIGYFFVPSTWNGSEYIICLYAWVFIESDAMYALVWSGPVLFSEAFGDSRSAKFQECKGPNRVRCEAFTVQYRV